MATIKEVESILRRSLILLAVSLSLSVGCTLSTPCVDEPDVAHSGLLSLPQASQRSGAVEETLR